MMPLIWQRDSSRLKIYLESGVLEIIPRSHNCIQVRETLDGVEKYHSHMVVNTDVFDDWLVVEDQDGLLITTVSVQLRVDLEHNLMWSDRKGNLLLEEPIHARDLILKDVKRYRYDPSIPAEVVKTVDGERTVGVPVEVYNDRKAVKYEQRYNLSQSEAIYGLGHHEEDQFNLRDSSQLLFQANMKSPSPIIISTEGYGLFFDTAAVSGFSAKDDLMTFWSDCADSLSYYFLYGPDFDAIIASIRKLTGKVTMLPRWAFGYIQSRERYVSADELLDTADEFRARQIPIDCLVQDWKYWPNDWWGEKSFDSDRFPQPLELMDRLHERNLKLMVSIWPNLSSGGTNHKELNDANFLLGDNSSYNAFLSDARKMYWDQTKSGIFQHGVDAWWCDSTEPFNNEWGGSKKPNDKTRLTMVDESFNRYLDPADANAFALVHAEGVYSGQRSSCNRRRVMNLTRSSYPGQQRYGCVVWSGDISARWDVLRQQVATGLNFCATGIPYWTVDIGAFFVGGHNSFKKWIGNDNAEPVWFWNGDYDQGVEDLGYRELYVRWLQWGTFLPIMRSHGTDTPREPWQFESSELPFYEIILNYIKLRYQLMPYIYSLAGWQTIKNYTMMRLLAFDFRDDPMVYNIADQYMLGPSLMICPVTEPMYFGPGSEPLKDINKTRSVYLPSGSDWYDYWTGQKYSGGQTILVDCPLDTIPVFAKAGSIIPLGSPIEHSGESQELTIRVFPGNNVSFDLYNDAGDGYDYEDGNYSLIKLLWDEEDQRLSQDSNLKAAVEVVGARSKDKHYEMASGSGIVNRAVRVLPKSC